MASFCIIRKFKEGDQPQIKEIINECVMDQFKHYFWRTVFSEILPQVALAFIAITYIFFGMPLKWALFFGPLSLLFILVATWSGLSIKASELGSDVDNIPNNYMKDDSTTFIVAEYYGKVGEAEIYSLLDKPKKFEYNFYNEKEFQLGNINIKGLSNCIVGCVAITRSMNHSQRAWLRRMVVKSTYRRREIGTHLLREAVKFCEQKKYAGIELIVTDNHYAAKQMFRNEGFLSAESHHKSFLGFGSILMSFKMYLPLNISDVEDTSESLTKPEEKDLINF